MHMAQVCPGQLSWDEKQGGESKVCSQHWERANGEKVCRLLHCQILHKSQSSVQSDWRGEEKNFQHCETISCKSWERLNNILWQFDHFDNHYLWMCVFVFVCVRVCLWSPYQRQGIPANAWGWGVCVYLIRASLAHSWRPPVGITCSVGITLLAWVLSSGYYPVGNTWWIWPTDHPVPDHTCTPANDPVLHHFTLSCPGYQNT